jgi:hypothetical protein
MINNIHLPGKVVLLWEEGYYDGILSGVGMYNGNMCYFDLRDAMDPLWLPDNNGDESNHDWYRKFNIYELCGDDKIRKTLVHAAWQLYVGLHCDHFPIDGKNIRKSRIKNESSFDVPILHFGLNDNTDDAFNAYKDIVQKLEEKYGEFQKNNLKLLGWVFYDQVQQNYKLDQDE